MNRNTAWCVLLGLTVLLGGMTACVSSHKLPLINGREIVAIVNDEPITRDEYQQEISLLHANMLEKENHDPAADGEKTEGKKAGKIDYAGLLQRMINARLVVQEAKRIGLNDLPEVRQEVESYSRKVLRTLLMKQAVKDVTPDKGLAETLYEKSVTEWKIGSVMFPKEDDAKKLEAAVRAGGSFKELAHKALADKKAKGGVDEGFLSGSDILTQIYDALLTMGTGSVSPVIPVPGGYAVVKLEDKRREESPEKKERASQAALRMKKSEASQKFIEALKKRLVTIDTGLLDSLDLGPSLEEFDMLLKDERVVAVIGGDEKIKVSDLTAAVKRTSYHGVEREIEKKGLQEKKYNVLDRMVEEKMLVKEAINEGIDKTDEYVVLVNTYEKSLVFGMFVQSVVLPDVKVMESEVKAYYESHRSDYTSPQTMQLDSVVFKNRGDAEEAMRKLRAGDQLSWIKANAGGQVGKDAAGLVELSGDVVAISSLEEGLKTALSGASGGNFRLYESPEGYFYVVAVLAVHPPKTEDYLTVRGQIAKHLYNEHLKAGLDDWIAKLKSTATVKTYLQF